MKKNKISIIIFNPPAPHHQTPLLHHKIDYIFIVYLFTFITAAEINCFWFFPTLSAQGATPPTSTPFLSNQHCRAGRGSVCPRDCNTLHSRHKLISSTTMHLGQVHLGVTTGLVPPGAISSHSRIWDDGAARCQTMASLPRQLNACQPWLLRG